jgi:hypothetical protein
MIDPNVHEEAAKRIYDTYILPSLRKLKIDPQVELKMRMTYVLAFRRHVGDIARGAYDEGIKAVAQFVGSFDGQSRHEFMFEDMILYKFGQRKRKPRKLRRRR